MSPEKYLSFKLGKITSETKLVLWHVKFYVMAVFLLVSGIGNVKAISP